MSGGYYAVRRGRNTGVYYTWYYITVMGVAALLLLLFIIIIIIIGMSVELRLMDSLEQYLKNSLL